MRPRPTPPRHDLPCGPKVPLGTREDESAALEVELLLSTPKTVVVSVRAVDAGGRIREESLVIPRHNCVGDRPRLRALLQAAAEWVARRADAAIRRILVRTGGAWQVLHEPAAKLPLSPT